MSYGQFTCLILTPTRELAVQIKSHIQLVSRYTKFKVESNSASLWCLHVNFDLDCGGGRWNVHSQTRTSSETETRNCCCDTRSILGTTAGGEKERKPKGWMFASSFTLEQRTPREYVRSSILGHRWNRSHDWERTFRRLGGNYQTTEQVNCHLLDWFLAEPGIASLVIHRINSVRSSSSRPRWCYNVKSSRCTRRRNRRGNQKVKINSVCSEAKSMVLHFELRILCLATLIAAVGINGQPKIIDLTKQFGTVEKLSEARVNCPLEEKVISALLPLSLFSRSPCAV